MNSSTILVRYAPAKPNVFKPMPSNLAFWGLAIFIVSLGFFSWGLTAANAPYFDETWYVAGAREFLRSGNMMFEQHPPLAKLLITAGVAIFGDNPFGWRAMSVIFGATTLVAVFLWSFALFRNIAQSLWVTAITFFDQLLYIQARVAMLDIFLTAFCVLALAFFTFSMKEKEPSRSFRSFVLSGVFIGLATACKWSGMFLLFGLVAIILLVALMRLWQVRFADPRATDFYRPDLWVGMLPWKAAVAFGVIPFLVYFCTYLPQIIHAGSVSEFFASHRRMFEIWSGDPGTHPYASPWYTWPELIRPVWYLFHIAGDDPATWSGQNQAQAVVALPNPVILFLGEIAVFISAWRWIVRRDLDSMIVTIAFLASFLPWALNPKGLEFSYYYFPSILCLGPALGLALFRGRFAQRRWPARALLAVSGLCFVFFLPVLAAHIGVSPRGFNTRIWLQSWR
jgi:dolichyl-phosphate-mannose--protein O-mannosyl transferase